MGTIIGIDLGTTNSVAAYMEGNNPRIILTPEGERLLPSLVAFGKSGERLIGNPAKSQLITNINTIYSVKRLIGKRYSEVAPYLKQFNYSIVEGEEDTLKIKINDLLFSPEEISAMIIGRLKEAAEQRLDDTIEGAIITVPAYFNDTQRQATKDAGEIAGLNVLRIINEPTAASLAFSLDLKKKSNVVVYDFGGGTIDISVLEIQNDIIKVLATAGDINLGGNDFDVMLTNQLLEEIKEEYNVDLSDDKMAIQRLRDAAENAKKELSSVGEFEINLPFIADTDAGAVHLSRYYSRKEFEALIKEKIDRTFEICSAALNKADLTIDDIHEILLVGGSTRIPCIQKRIKEFFNKEPNKKVNPDEIVALGAAIQGSIATGESKDILLLDVIPISLGVKTFGGSFTRLIDANTTIPTNRSLVFSTVEDNQSEVEINVYQGEREIAEENKLLGNFTLTGIQKTPKGIARIEVLFSIDINGILTVTAIDLSTKNKREVVVSNSGLLSKEEIEKIKKNSEKFKESDLKKKELIKLKNEIFNYVYTIKRYLGNSKLEVDMASVAKGVIRAASDAIEKEVKEELEEIRDHLVDLNLMLSRTVTQPIESAGPAKSPRISKAYNDADARAQVFEAHETIGVTEIYENNNSIKKDIDIVFENEVKEKEPKTIATKNKEALKLMQKVLHSIYNIEQYMENLKLDDGLEMECNILIARAKAETDKKNIKELEKVEKELRKLNEKLETAARAAAGSVKESEPESKPRDVKSKKSETDTRPFKILKE
jgi:molecular chaperone DnaK